MLRRLYLLIVVLLVAIVTIAPVSTSQAQDKPELSIIWFAWPPCEALSGLAAKYTEATVTVKCVPLAQWHDQIFTDFAAKGGSDLLILDSQWIGEAVTGNHLLDLTDWMKSNLPLDDYVESALSAYGEYPPNSGRYYGVAAQADVQLLVYRKDLYEKAGLSAPKTWSELLSNAEKLKATGVDGFTWFWCGSAACYDQIQTAWNQIAWSFGGELWDANTYKVEGVLNSEANVKALEFAAKLYQTGPEGAGNFTYNEVVDAICTGKSAQTIIWAGFGAGFIDAEGCPQAANLAFAVPPGETAHFLSLGGMGVSVSAYTKNQDAALAFLKWFQSDETQAQWTAVGGTSARKSVLESDAFKNLTPYNAVFSEAYPLVKDFWNLPETNEMLIVQGEQLNLAVTGQKEPKAALDEIAQKQQEILDKAYPNGPEGGAAEGDSATMEATASQ